MKRSRPITFLATVAVVPLIAVTAATSAPAAPTRAQTTSTHSATVRVVHSHLGRILVNSNGRTVYLFKADSRRKSACFGACATAWPPLLAKGKPAVGAGLTASKLGTITRSGRQQQVTYNGHPLYLFIGDRKPGDVHGQGVTAFGAAWFALSPAGHQITG